MTIQLLLGDEIRSEVLKILSGECLFKRNRHRPQLHILSPWISDVDIEFSDLYVLREKRKYVEERRGGDFLFLDYNIKSINLPYALLLLKLHGGCEVENPVAVNIVTLPPNETNYSGDYLPKVKTLLDFLDEIGCNIFVNSKLHSKLLLANDLAVLGSFNLSSSALYYREEIGVSMNDLDNLDKLENYCWSVIHKSQNYGYSSLHSPLGSGSDRITRGFLLDLMVRDVYGYGYGEFLDITGRYDRFIKSYASDLNLFYLLNIRKLISIDDDWHRVKGKDWVKNVFHYKGDDSTDSIMEFINSKFARKTVPDVKLQIKPLHP